MPIPLSEPFQLHTICTCLDFHWDSAFRNLGESHGFWEMVYIVSGQVEVSRDELVYVMGPGDIIFYGSMEFHNIRSYGGTNPHVRIISFFHDGIIPPRLCQGVFSLGPEEAEEHRRIFELLMYLKAPAKRDPWGLADVRFSLSAFLLRIARKEPRQDRESRSRAASEYHRAVSAMKAAIYENLTVKALCARIAISQSTLGQLFRTYAGIGPAAYYDRLRCLEALRLLEEGRPIPQIAEELGYSSPNYFCACFKKQFGTPPGQWRASRSGK